MASLKDLRNRINSVKSTRKITSAMKMVAASKLRRAQEAAEASRPYAERMQRMLGNLAASTQGAAGSPPLLAGTGKDDVHLLVVLTANRGLCGGFNGNPVREARRQIQALKAQGKEVKLLCVGRKGRDLLRRDYKNLIVDSFEGLGRRGITYAEANQVAERLLTMFEAGEFDVCTIIFNKFQSAMTQVVTPRQIIPFPVPQDAEGTPQGAGGALYDYEPSEEGILKDLLPRNVAMQLFAALLESDASEQGARMTAMDSATRNAGDMIDGLTLTYNRTRQAAITKELIEIISGAEAL
ncbi:F0F1 ATP synthase subunit gamma [Roseospirillum parvum]|uniref:ATP synthase gamma chain n=1 Tax=Roseospirillum parvum TaxID=83401 RepID=A0A1G7USM7_9PROT|nr:F0F1 ATP synthase subunit gamma [Roseospirillum parvum]SDG50523.1 F-type H+-transporting ATPase subunit gamma [Roseospirillum parvum]